MPDISLLDLDPTLRALAQEWLDECIAKGLDVKITETFRDPAREDALHAQGITLATSKTCVHCDVDADGNPASQAFDFGCFRNHVLIQNGEDVAYALAGKIAESFKDEEGDPIALWGGHFVHAPPDWDHIQLRTSGATILPFPAKSS